MVSTEKRYKFDNFPVLHHAVLRGEKLYQVRLYFERAAYTSEQSGLTRMRFLLAFIEARAAVIDAVIKTEANLHYLCVVCSSIASPVKFSDIMKRTAPRAIIEQLDQRQAESIIASRSVRDEPWNDIPYSRAVRTVHESRRILLTLLLEYRALLAECDSMLPSRNDGCSLNNTEFTIPVLLFELDGIICGVPDYQIDNISPGANGSQIIELHQSFGKRIIICDDLICIKELDIVACAFTGKKKRGYYTVSTPVTGGTFDFTLIVPAFL